MKKIYSVLATIVIIFSIGCSNRLELYPLTQISEGTFYQNETEIQQAVDDIYRQLGKIYDANGLPDLFGELYSDNTTIKFSQGGNNFPEQITKLSIETDNGLINAAWNQCYSSIYICNNVLEKIDNRTFEMEAAKVNLIKAQVLLIRSLIYFDMVRAWGAVPYLDKKVSPSDSYNYLRVEPSVIYPKLIADLQYCKEILPESYTGTNIGRATKYGAAAILAKLYLTLNDKAKAKTELESIINSNLYSLDANNDGTINKNDYLYIFAPATKNCKSSILEVQYLAGQNAVNSTHQYYYMPYYWSFHLPSQTVTFRGEGRNTPSSDLIAEFEMNDPRKDVSAQLGYIDLSTGSFIDYPFTMKFYDPNWEYAGQNFEIIRYADILLMYTEVTDDPKYMNAVRARVGLPAYGSTDYPSTKYSTLALAIEHERRVELCFEYHRFFDLVRTNRAVDLMKAKGYTMNSYKLLFPIPLYAIDVNKGLVQNPGY